MKVDAFVLNELVVAGPPSAAKGPKGKVHIAPITQPNYTFLRLDNGVIQNDVLDHVDLHYTSPLNRNSRLYDLGANQKRQNRQGVYISWTMPRVYRSGTAATESAGSQNSARQQEGYPPIDPTAQPDYSAPTFRPVPTRWIVVRHIDTSTIKPAVSADVAQKLQCQAWVVESDAQFNITDLDQTVDLQTDVSPFIAPGRNNDQSTIEQQAEVFIGKKTALSDWSEKGNSVPRINSLSILDSSNHLFADYQPHNSNVFSMVDGFSYLDASNKIQYITSAAASYFVIGYHVDPTQDLFYIQPAATTLGARLSSLQMTAADANDQGFIDWSSKSVSARMVCHGTVYDVKWDANELPASMPAQDAADNLLQQPIGVGTSPLETLLAYVQAHVDTDTGDIKQLEEDILAIQTLLIAQDEGVDSQMEAKDLLISHAYDRVGGGLCWHLTGVKDGTVPNAEDVAILMKMNDTQLALDNALRTVDGLRWDLFSDWWKWVSAADQTPDLQTKIAAEVTTITSRLGALIGPTSQPSVQSIASWMTEINNYKMQLPQAESSANDSFYQQKDPTMLVGGIQPGWQYDYLSSLLTRLESQTVTSTIDDPTWNTFQALLDLVGSKLPSEQSTINTCVLNLLGEFYALRPESTMIKPPAGKFFPLYHDQGLNPGNIATAPWRDRWENTQPWLPLYLEWEAEYFHIPYENWTLDQPSDGGPARQLQYIIKPGVNLEDLQIADIRTLSGRVLMLPQASYSLSSSISQLFNNTTTTILDQYLSKDQRDFLLKNLYKLPFLSSPMIGLTEHLVTQVTGTHIKPSQRPPGEELTPMAAALAAGLQIGTRVQQINLMGTQTSLTPYGDLIVNLDTKYPCFKPVTHGQLRFTQINIIDKFGQAVCALDPTPAPTAQLPHLAPIVSNFYACQAYAPGVPNVVERNVKPPMCEFVQLPPSINQMARLNSYYVIPDSDNAPHWRPVNEWENPIWGWLIVNLADYALQIFLQDGTFYREVRLGGPTGVTETSAWSPFQPPAQALDTKQIDHFLANIVGTDPTYLNSFFQMINGAFANLAPAPGSYAQYLGSIIGKPLALVNMGWSLELATDALTNQSTKNTLPPTIPLLPPVSVGQTKSISRDTVPQSSTSSVAPPGSVAPSSYSFKVKIGDEERTYDGLVGYWNSSPSVAYGFDYSKIYTYFPSKIENSPTVQIANANFPVFEPFWISPDTSTSTAPTVLDPSAIVKARNSQMTIFAALVDPFTSLHGYSGFMPVEELVLPPWTMEQALQKMTAFFHMGPLICTQDVPAFNSDYVLKSDYNLQDPEQLFPGPGLPIPSVAQAQWSWLQPYPHQKTVGVVARRSLTEEDKKRAKRRAPKTAQAKDAAPPAAETATATNDPLFMALGVETVDARPRFEAAPYTAVEGYLQLRQPILSPKQ
jgi:hypothetical protein